MKLSETQKNIIALALVMLVCAAVGVLLGKLLLWLIGPFWFFIAMCGTLGAMIGWRL